MDLTVLLLFVFCTENYNGILNLKPSIAGSCFKVIIVLGHTSSVSR